MIVYAQPVMTSTPGPVTSPQRSVTSQHRDSRASVSSMTSQQDPVTSQHRVGHGAVGPVTSPQRPATSAQRITTSKHRDGRSAMSPMTSEYGPVTSAQRSVTSSQHRDGHVMATTADSLMCFHHTTLYLARIHTNQVGISTLGLFPNPGFGAEEHQIWVLGLWSDLGCLNYAKTSTRGPES